MRSLQFHQFGEPHEVLGLAENPLPEPAPGTLRVRMSLRPINPSDLFQIRGRYGRLPELPATAGLEGLGTVDAVGSEVPDHWLGQKVVFREAQGTWGEWMVTEPSNCLGVPVGVPDEAAAQAMVNPLTALAIVEELAPGPSDWILLTAPTSAVAHCVLDLARVRKFPVLALTRSPDRIQDLRGLGAAEALCTENPAWTSAAKSLLGPQGAAGCLDAVGGTLASDIAKLLRPGGTHLVYGALSLEPLLIPGGQIIYRQLTVRGFTIVMWKRAVDPARFATILDALWVHQREGLLCPPVAAVHPLAHHRMAIRQAETHGRKGKILLSG